MVQDIARRHAEDQVVALVAGGVAEHAAGSATSSPATARSAATTPAARSTASGTAASLPTAIAARAAVAATAKGGVGRRGGRGCSLRFVAEANGPAHAQVDGEL